jgi:hypothetical protein
MITARSKAKKEMSRILDDRINQHAKIVTRFFRWVPSLLVVFVADSFMGRYIKMRKWTKNLEKENQIRAALVLQKGFRTFAARKRCVE